MLAFHKRISYDKNRTCDWRSVDETTGEHVTSESRPPGRLAGRMSRRFFMRRPVQQKFAAKAAHGPRGE